MAEEKKDRSIVYWTADQKEIMTLAAEKLGLSINQYMKSAALEKAAK